MEERSGVEDAVKRRRAAHGDADRRLAVTFLALSPINADSKSSARVTDWLWNRAVSLTFHKPLRP